MDNSAKIQMLECRNRLLQRYLDFYIAKDNISSYAFAVAIERNERAIARLRG